LACSSSGISVDLVEEQRAAVGRSKSPARLVAPVKLPFSWPNSSLSISVGDPRRS
jgi:hypothetical protein